MINMSILAQATFSWLPTIGTGLSILTAIYFAVYAFRKAKPEATAILVDAAKDIVVLQRGELQRLQSSLADAHKKLGALQASFDDLLANHKAVCIKLQEEEKKSSELERKLNEFLRKNDK